MFRSLMILELSWVLGAHPSVEPTRSAVAEISPPLFSSLSSAILSGDLEQVSALVGNGSASQYRDDVGIAPLSLAVLAGREHIVRYLLKHGAEINARDPATGSTALRAAVITRKPEMVKILLSGGARFDFAYDHHQTVLHIAVIAKNSQIVESLLAAGIAPDTLDETGKTALEYAVLGRQTEICALLLKAGANPHHASSSDGRGPLQNACIKDLPTVALMLIQAGADAVAVDGSGQTPLDLALDYQSSRTVSALFSAIPRYAQLRSCFEKAMGTALAHGRTTIISLLLDSGWSVNQRSSSGATYLGDAALKGDARSVRLLLDRGARCNLRSETGNTPLHDGALGGSIEVIDLLLQRSLPVDSRNTESGATPLMLAASMGRSEAVALLLRRGANPTLRDYSGQTASQRAQEGQFSSLVKLLESSEMARRSTADVPSPRARSSRSRLPQKT